MATDELGSYYKTDDIEEYKLLGDIIEGDYNERTGIYVGRSKIFRAQFGKKFTSQRLCFLIQRTCTGSSEHIISCGSSSKIPPYFASEFM